ncbi:MAG: hypothetical protein WAV90_13640 [Gordonia amarae]
MSWDASLSRSATDEDEWNYTHNCNHMANAVLYPDFDTSRTVFSELLDPQCPSWWQLLDGLDGPESRRLLDRVITGMRAEPARFRAMNPSNGWGDYDRFLRVLERMRAAIPESGTVRWIVSG